MADKGKPQPKDLKKLYSKVVTAELGERVLALRAIVGWYTVALEFARQSLDPSRQRFLGKAEKAVDLAKQGASEHEQETALKTGIALLEKVLAGMIPDAPSIQKIYVKFSKEEAQLKKVAEALKLQYSSLLGLLEGAYAKYGIRFLIREGDTARQFDGNGHVYYSSDHADSLLKQVAEGQAIPVLLSELPTVIRVASLENSGGNVSMNPKLVNKNLATITEGLSAFVSALAENPNVTVRTDSILSEPKKNKSEPKRKYHVKPRGKLYYRPGSRFYTLMERLHASGGDISQADLFKGMQASDPARMLRKVESDGDETGLWTLRKSRRGEVTFHVL
jgi:hypothetical protein